MPIEPVQEQNKPLLNIQLPTSISGNPSEPLLIGMHNASAKKNFEQVANLIFAVINNQKLMGLAIKQQDDQIKELKKVLENLTENLGKLLEKNEKPTTK